MFSLAQNGMIDRDSVHAWAQNAHLSYVKSARDDDTSTQGTYDDQDENNYVANQLEETVSHVIFHFIAVTQSRIAPYSITHFLTTRAAMFMYFVSLSGYTETILRSPSSTSEG